MMQVEASVTNTDEGEKKQYKGGDFSKYDVFVGNLPANCTEDQVTTYFEGQGLTTASVFLRFGKGKKKYHCDIV